VVGIEPFLPFYVIVAVGIILTQAAERRLRPGWWLAAAIVLGGAAAYLNRSAFVALRAVAVVSGDPVLASQMARSAVPGLVGLLVVFLPTAVAGVIAAQRAGLRPLRVLPAAWLESLDRPSPAEPPPRVRGLLALGLGVAGGLAMAALNIAGSLWLSSGGVPLPAWAQVLKASGPSGPLLGLVSLQAAVTEETLYRLFVLGVATWAASSLFPSRRRWLPVAAGIVVSSAVFGVMHGPVVALWGATLGALVGLMYVGWGLEAVLIVHFLADFASWGVLLRHLG